MKWFSTTRIFLTQAEAEMQEQNLISYYQKTKQREHQNMLQRKFIIEQRKEQLEHLNQERVSGIERGYNVLSSMLFYTDS